MALVGTMPREVVVIVDPVSTGRPLVKIACSRGFLVVVLWSKKLVEHTSGTLSSDSSQVKQIDAYEAYLVVQEQASTPATVKAIEGALCPLGAFEITACIPGSERGVNLADLVSFELSLCSSGSGNKPFHGGDRQNKHVQRNALEMAGCRAVREICGYSWDVVHGHLKDLGLPMVVKPVQSAGTDGVKLCHTVQAAKEHFHHLQVTKRKVVACDNAILLQEFLDGEEYAVDHVSRNGVHKTIMVWTYRKQTVNGGDFGCTHFEPVETIDCPRGLISYVRAALDALEIRNGATHTEVMVTADGPCLVEVNTRMVGADGCHISLARLLTGTSHPDATLDCASQKRFDALPDIPRAFQGSGLIVPLVSYFSGRVESTPGYERMKNMVSFLELCSFISAGSEVQVTLDCFTCAGFLVLAGSHEQVWADLEKVRQLEKEGLFCFTEARCSA